MKYTKEERVKVYKKALRQYTQEFAESCFWVGSITSGLCDVFDGLGYNINKLPEIVNQAHRYKGNKSRYWWESLDTYKAVVIRRKVLRNAISELTTP